MAEVKDPKKDEKKKPADKAPAEAAPPEEPEAESGDDNPGVEVEKNEADLPEAKPAEEKEGEGEGDGKGKETEPEEEPSNDEVADLISALSEHNINLDMEAVKTPKDLVKHLTIALRALKGVLQPGQAGGAGGTVEEQPSTTLSDDSPAVDPKISALQSKLAESELKHVVSRIDSLVANGQVKGHRAKKWVASLTEQQLGLVDDEPGVNLAVIKAQIDFATSDIPPGTLFGMTAKELAEKYGSGGGPADLSADEVDPVDTQKWGGTNTTDPEKIKEIAAKFMKETKLVE